MMSRTEEQKTADEALTAAIEAAVRAYFEDEGWVTAEYLVVAAQNRLGPGGEPETSIIQLNRDGDIPTYRALGLVEFLAARMRANAAAAD